jgi:Ca-activated chloride channel homolog
VINGDIDVQRRGNLQDNVTYTGTNEIPSSDFRLLYDVGKGEVGTSVISYRPKADEEGYLLLLTTPEIKAASDDRPKKTVLFVLERFLQRTRPTGELGTLFALGPGFSAEQVFFRW